jgi:uncharacterized membrane protein
LIIPAAFVAFVLKLIIASNTFGTNDVITFYEFARSLHQHGLQWTYQNDISFNHPPLTAYYLQAIYLLDHQPALREFGLSFPFLIRLPGIFADLITCLALWWVTKKDPRIVIPPWALLLFALSPVSLMISGFHGNTDPVMVMFFVLAALSTLRGMPVLAGIMLALSCQVKIIPILFLPIFFFYFNKRAKTVAFVIPFALCSIALWMEPLLHFPMLFVKNVLSYGSFWGIWGISYWLRLTNLPQFGVVTFHHFPPWEALVVTALKILIVIAMLGLAWRRRGLNEHDFINSLAYGWIVFFIFSPGVCVQYMIWLAPFILFLSARFYAWLTATSCLFVFFFYNIIAGGLPWYVAISTNQLNRVWTPWTVWPWLVLIIGLVCLWRNAVAKTPGLRLLSLKIVA